MTEPKWVSTSRLPRAYESVICKAEDGQEYHGMCWSRARGEFIEPISNRAAEPVIGKIVGWRYPEPEPDSGLSGP